MLSSIFGCSWSNESGRWPWAPLHLKSPLGSPANASSRAPQERSEERAEALIADYLDLLESQSQQPGFHAYRELAEIGQHYDLIVAVNFPEVFQKSLSELSRLFGRALAKQNPVGGQSA